MNKKDTIITLFLIASISYFSYKLGQGDPIVAEKCYVYYPKRLI